MKRFVAIIFLFVILCQSMSTLYIFTTFYANRDYISKNICINRFDKIPVCKGQCYLNKKLTENENQEKKFPDLKQKEIQLFFEQKELFDDVYKPLEQFNTFRNYVAAFIPSSYSSSVFHPPQLS